MQQFSVLAVGLLVLATSVLLFSFGVHRAYVGAEVKYNAGAYVVDYVDPDGLAYAAGLRPGDIAIEMDGVKLGGDATVAAPLSGRVAESLIAVNHDGRQVAVQVQGSEAPWSSAVMPSAVFAVGLFFWLIGLFTFVKRPNSNPARLLFLVSGSILLALVGSAATTRNVPTAITTQVIDWLALPVLFLHLFLEFPDGRNRARRPTWCYWSLYGWMAVALVSYFAIGNRPGVFYPYFRAFLFLNLSAGILMGTISLIMAWLTASQPRVRQQTKIVVAGTVVGTIPFLALSIFPEVFLGKTLVAPEIAILAVLLMPASIAYSIVKHRLLDIDLVIRRGLVYASMTGMLAVAFFILLAVVGALWQSLVSVERMAVTLGLSAAAAVLFGPAKDALGAIFDGLFYKDRYDYSKQVKEMTGALASLRDEGDISRFGTSSITAQLQLAGAMVCVDEPLGHFDVLAASGDFVDKARQGLLFELLPRLGPELTFPNASPSGSPAAYVIPLMANNRGLGFLCLGPKLSGQPYSVDDIYLLHGFAPAMAAAIQSSRLLAEIGSRDEQLKVAHQGLRESEGQYKALVEAGGQMGVGIVLLQNNSHIEAAHVFANEEWARLTGFPIESLKGKSYFDLIHPLYRDAVAARVRQGLQGRETPGRYEIYVVARDGAEIPVEATGAPVTYQGRPAVVGYLRNITDRKLTESKLREMATRDFLTGLWNHREFQSRLPVEIARAQRSGEHFCLLFVDIDHFKAVNDRFGHQMGDRVLQTMGKLLSDVLRTSDIACRYGGDEFAIILPNTDVAHSAALVARILHTSAELCDKEVLLKSMLPWPGLSVGVAGYPEDATEAQELVRKANQSMFYAKSQGGNRAQVWGEAMREFEAEPEKLRTLLRQANLDTALALAGAIDARDAHTLGHSKRVSDMAAAVAREMGLSEIDIEGIRISGLLHDVGKIGLADALLHKRNPLTEEETRTVKRHVELGVKMLGSLDYMKDKLGIIHGHHENWDGTGYPQGLAGENIALGARIIRAVDTLDAMITDRPYRRHLSLEQALKEIESLSGKAFDPAVVAAVKAVIRKG